MGKTLSIIIPTYNMETLLDQCLTSLILLYKEYREMLDVIVVIDGATDRSSEIAHSYADKYPEMFSVIDKENGNYGSCINAALPHVKGKYVRILDADDSYVTSELASYLETLNNNDVDLFLTDYDTVDPDGNVKISSKLPFTPHKSFGFEEIDPELFIVMHDVAYRSSIFQEIDYHQTEGVSYTDLEWVFHPMSCVKTVYYYPKTIYKYLMGREGQTIDGLTMLKRLSHMEKGLWTQLAVYKEIPSSNVAYPYLSRVIRYRTHLLYTWGLDKNADFDLDDFDKRLKDEYPDIYELATTFTLPLGISNYKMPIVKMWRRVRSKTLLRFHPLYMLSTIVNRLNVK